MCACVCSYTLVCACMHACVCMCVYVSVCVSVCVYKSKVDLGCHLEISALFFETGSVPVYEASSL